MLKPLNYLDTLMLLSPVWRLDLVSEAVAGGCKGLHVEGVGTGMCCVRTQALVTTW